MTNQDMTIPSQDERIMAALAHITILVPFMGVVAPIVIWVTQKEKSRFVGFQALQAVVFQLTLVLAWFIGMGCYMGSFIFSFIGMAGLGANHSSGPEVGPTEVFSAIWVFIPFITMGLMIIVGFAAIIYGVIAAIQALRGKAFRYAIIGSRVERFLQQDKPAPTHPAETVP